MEDKAWSKGQIVALILGPVLFGLTLLLLPVGLLTFEARVAVSTVIWMGFWWITVPVIAAVTAFIPILVNAVFNILPMGGIISDYFSEIVVLLFGVDLLAIAWQVTGFDRRLSLKALCIIGPSATQQIIIWFVLPALLSTVLPNAVVCMVLTPIAFAMLQYVSHEGSPIRSIILLAIAWGAGVGGVGTPLGGAMNLIAVGSFEELTGREFAYLDWILRLVPFMLLLILVGVLYLLLIKPKNVSLEGSKEYFRGLYQELPPMNRDELLSVVLFGVAMLLAFVRPLFEPWLPGLKPAYIFLLFGMFTFVLPKQNGEPLLTWEKAEKSIGWNLLFLIAGGLAVGGMISDSGAAQVVAGLLATCNLTGGLGTILLFVGFTIMLAEIASNTAAAAIALPVVISVTQELNLNPIPYIFITAAAFNCAYILPTSIRAIPVAFGLKPSFMGKNGVALTLLSILTISLFGWLLLRFVPAFGVI